MFSMPVFIASLLNWLCRMTNSVNENYIWWQVLCQKSLMPFDKTIDFAQFLICQVAFEATTTVAPWFPRQII